MGPFTSKSGVGDVVFGRGGGERIVTGNYFTKASCPSSNEPFVDAELQEEKSTHHNRAVVTFGRVAVGTETDSVYLLSWSAVPAASDVPAASELSAASDVTDGRLGTCPPAMF